MGFAIDRAIESIQDDRLGLTAFARGLARTLLNDERTSARGAIIGLEGAWGSGKSSILSMVAEELRSTSPNVILVRFDPWLVSGRDDLIAAFFAELRSSVLSAAKNTDALKKLVSTLSSYGETLAPAANILLAGAGEIGKSAFKMVRTLTDAEKTLERKRMEVRDALKALDRPLIVLIDELDRVEDGEVRAVAQLVRAVLDFPNISYILAYDPRRVTEALGGGASDLELARGEAYLEKIVQFRVTVPAQAPAALRRILRSDFSEMLAKQAGAGQEYDEEWLHILLDRVVPTAIANLRDAQRSLATFSVLEPMLRHEINVVDLLGWSILQAKLPDTPRWLNRNLASVCKQALLSGPHLLTALMERHSGLRLAETLFGEDAFADAAGIAKLLLLREGFDQTDRFMPNDAIAHQDNLLVALTQGAYTQYTAMESILASLNQGYDGLRALAIVAWKRNSLEYLLARIVVGCPKLPSEVAGALPMLLVQLAEDQNAFGPLPARRRAHQALALTFVCLLRHATSNWAVNELCNAAQGGQAVLASHVVILAQRVRVLAQNDIVDNGEIFWKFDLTHLAEVKRALTEWANASTKDKAFVLALSDPEQLHALAISKLVTEYFAQSLWGACADDNALDHLVGLLGDHSAHLDDVPLGYFTPDDAAIKTVLRDRIARVPSPTSKGAYDRLLSKLS